MPPEIRVRPGERVAVLWPGAGALAWWYGEAVPHAEMLCVEPSRANVATGRVAVPSAEWATADPFYAATWRTASPYDLVLARVPTSVRVKRRLAVDFSVPPLMVLDLALNIGRRAAVFVPAKFSPTVAGDVFRERFGYAHEQALVDRFRADHPSMRAVPLAHPVTPEWDRSDAWGSKDLVLVWTDPETTDVVVTVSAGPSGIRIVHQQPSE